MAQHEQQPGAPTRYLLDNLARDIDISRRSGDRTRDNAYKHRILPMFVVLAAADIRFVSGMTSIWFERAATEHLDILHDNWVTQHHRAHELLGIDRGPGFTGMILRPAAHQVLEQQPPIGFTGIRSLVHEELEHGQRISQFAAAALTEYQSQAVKL